jgi:putative thioredoxin
MDTMTSAAFNRAFDLSGIKAAAQAKPAPPGASYVLDVDERSFEATMTASMKHPIVLELTSPRAHGATELSQALAELANEAGGAYLLARIDVDAVPQIAQALGVQAVPMVVGVVAGQLAPLFQGTKTKAEASAAIQQLLQVCATNGLVGRAEPASIDPEVAQSDTRYAAADAALERGDYAAARDEFDKILTQSPNDPEAIAGRAQASLLHRLAGLDPAAVLADAAARPDDLAVQLRAADLEVGTGRPERGFARLIEVIRVTSGVERNDVRVRLLDLFETVGTTDPAVLKARRDLMSALF